MKAAYVWVVGGLVILTAAAAACDTYPSQLRLGVSKTDRQGRISIHVITCPFERVLGVELLQPKVPDGSSGRIETLWDVRSGRGSRQRIYIVGTDPLGFESIVRLRSGWVPTSSLTAAIRTTDDPHVA